MPKEEADNLRLKVSSLTREPEIYIGRVNKNRTVFLERRVCTGEFMNTLIEYVGVNDPKYNGGVELKFTNIDGQKYTLTLKKGQRETDEVKGRTGGKKYPTHHERAIEGSCGVPGED